MVLNNKTLSAYSLTIESMLIKCLGKSSERTSTCSPKFRWKATYVRMSLTAGIIISYVNFTRMFPSEIMLCVTKLYMIAI